MGILRIRVLFNQINGFRIFESVQYLLLVSWSTRLESTPRSILIDGMLYKTKTVKSGKFRSVFVKESFRHKMHTTRQ